MSKPFLNIFYDEKSVDRVAIQIEEYANSINDKIDRAIKRLLDIGVSVAIASANTNDTHHFAGLCDFTYTTKRIEGGVEGYVYGHGTPFESHWVDSDGKPHDDIVYPLLMLEFGSAGRALSSIDVGQTFGADRSSIGRGSFSVRGNENKLSWYFIEEIGEEKQLGTAVKPNRPMFNAGQTIYDKAIAIIREEFKE